MISLLGDPAPMLRALLAEMAARGLPTDLSCDHMCYRVETEERYQELKTELSKLATLASEVPISGRLICTFHLHAPYHFEGRVIDCLELPAPKHGSPYKEGWEHAEFVTGEPMDVFMARYPGFDFDTRSLNKRLNPELGLKLFSGYQIKFHPRSLLEVVEDEKRELGLL